MAMTPVSAAPSGPLPLEMYEWVDSFRMIAGGGSGALICALVGGAFGAATGTDGAERVDYAKWGAIVGVIAGALESRPWPSSGA